VVSGLLRRAGGLCVPVLLACLACGGDDAGPGDPAAAGEPPADGEVYEAEYGRENQLPSNFPEDVPLYSDAEPVSSMSAPAHGTVVNLRTGDAPETVFAWYQTHYADKGWEIEQQIEERGRRTILARKGNRVSSVVIMGGPGATQALLTVAEDR